MNGFQAENETVKNALFNEESAKLTAFFAQAMELIPARDISGK